MQYVIILALLYFLFSSSSKKKKRAEQQKRQPDAAQKVRPAPEPPEPAEEEPEEEATAQGADAKTLTPDEWEAYLKMQAEKSAAEQAEAPSEPHESDAQSLPVSAPEGETHAEHAAHNERVHEREQAERQRAEDARARRYASRQRLREAVIMREILDKPVSMRRNRTI